MKTKKIGFEAVGLAFGITYLVLMTLIEILDVSGSSLVGLLQKILETATPAIIGFMMAWALIRITER